MDEDEIAKMMEEEDFAQQQLKLAGEVIRNKKLKDTESDIKKKDGIPEDLEQPLPLPVSLAIPDIPLSMYSAQHTGSKLVTTPKKRGRKTKDDLLPTEITKSPNTNELQQPSSAIVVTPQAPKTTELPIHGPTTIHHLPQAPRNQTVPSVPPQAIHMPSIPNHLIQPGASLQHTPSVIAHSSMLLQRNPQLPSTPLQHSAATTVTAITSSIINPQQIAQAQSIAAHQLLPSRNIPPQLIQSAIRQQQQQITAQSPISQNLSQQLSSQRPPGSLLGISSAQEPIIPTTVLAVQNTKLLDPSELGQPASDTSPVKKRGRRKKFTPLREIIPPTSSSSAPEIHHSLPVTTTATPALEAPKSSILSERLSSNQPGN